MTSHFLARVDREFVTRIERGGGWAIDLSVYVDRGGGGARAELRDPNDERRAVLDISREAIAPFAKSLLEAGEALERRRSEVGCAVGFTGSASSQTKDQS